MTSVICSPTNSLRPFRRIEISDHVTDHLDSFWQLATDSLSPQDAETLTEDLGIEFDTTEHKAVEKGSWCVIQGTNTRSNLKRKRE